MMPASLIAAAPILGVSLWVIDESYGEKLVSALARQGQRREPSLAAALAADVRLGRRQLQRYPIGLGLERLDLELAGLQRLVRH